MSSPAAGSHIVMLSGIVHTKSEGSAAVFNDCLNLIPLIIVPLLIEPSMTAKGSCQCMCTPACAMAAKSCHHRLQLHGLAYVPTPSEIQMMPLQSHKTLHPQEKETNTNTYSVDFC